MKKDPNDVSSWYFGQLVNEAKQSMDCLQAVYNRLCRWGAKQVAEDVLNEVVESK